MKRERWKGTEIVARKLARGRGEPCEGNREAGKKRWNESSGLPPHLLSLPTDVDKILHGPCERDTEKPFLATNSNNGDAWFLSSVASLRGSSSSMTTIEKEVEHEKTTKKLPNTLFN